MDSCGWEGLIPECRPGNSAFSRSTKVRLEVSAESDLLSSFVLFFYTGFENPCGLYIHSLSIWSSHNSTAQRPVWLWLHPGGCTTSGCPRHMAWSHRGTPRPCAADPFLPPALLRGRGPALTLILGCTLRTCQAPLPPMV